MIPKTKVEEILDRADILTVVGEYVTLQKKGANFWGLCPFHQEKSPSFSVTPQKNIFYCFGCHKGGNSAAFVMEMEHIGYGEALRLLAQKAGIQIEESRDQDNPQDKQNQALYELFSRIAKTFTHFLLKDPQGKEALELLTSRGISLTSIEKFSLGYAPADRWWLHGFLKSKNYTPDFLVLSGLFSAQYPEISPFSGRLIFPIKNSRGQFIAFGGRLLGKQEGPKYLNSPENPVFKKRANLYGIDLALPEIRKTRTAYLCEGYMDVIAFHQAGQINAVAPLGTAFTPEQALFLKRAADKIILVFDGDSAGQKAALRSIPLCEEAGLESETIILPQDQDPSSILEKEGADSLKNISKYSINSFEFALDYFISTNTKDGRIDLRTAMESIFVLADCITTEVKRESFFQTVAKKLKVGSKTIVTDYQNRKLPRKPKVLEPNTLEMPTKSGPDFQLLLVVLSHGEFYPVLRRHLTPQDFDEPVSKRLFEWFEEKLGNFGLDQFMAEWEESPLKKEALQRLSTGELDQNPEQFLNDGVRRIKVRSLEKKRRSILDSLSNEGLMPEDLEGLLEEKMFIDSEIERYKVSTNV